MKRQPPECPDTRPCFGKRKHLGKWVCMVLTPVRHSVRMGDITGYEYEFYETDGECPFCKPDRQITHGVFYEDKPQKGEDTIEEGNNDNDRRGDDIPGEDVSGEGRQAPEG